MILLLHLCDTEGPGVEDTHLPLGEKKVLVELLDNESGKWEVASMGLTEKKEHPHHDQE